jgi:hypothetical protein
LLRDDLAPETILVGRRRLITIEAARKWRERMTKLSNPAPKTNAKKVSAERDNVRP